MKRRLVEQRCTGYGSVLRLDGRLQKAHRVD
jgi:hypothetical protein